MFELRFARLDARKAKKTVVLFSVYGNKLLEEGTAFDQACGGIVSRAMRRGRFNSDYGVIRVVDTPALPSVNEVFVVGLGPVGKLKANSFRVLGIRLAKALEQHGVSQATVVFETMDKLRLDLGLAAEEFLEGVHLGLYRYDAYRQVKPTERLSFEKLTIMIEGKPAKYLKAAAGQVSALIDGVNLTRDLVNCPPNICNADLFAKEAEGLAKLGLDVKILGQKELAKEGLNMMLAVNKGSNVEPKLIVMKWTGAGAKKPYRAIVGKGVTFDTGGYSIKPADMMPPMKGDMAGAGAVMGLMKALARRKSKVNVIGVCGCVENMINGEATRPSDIIKAYNGLFVEVNNTDAEGRLVLGDAMAYIVDKEKPAEVIDIATLTGACMIALGSAYAGVFSNSDRIAGRLTSAGEDAGELLWRLPLGAAYEKQLKSQTADVSNVGSRWGGASTAAVFLEKFVGDTPWAHLDIAGVALADKMGAGEGELKGASGFGVRLLTKYLESKDAE